MFPKGFKKKQIMKQHSRLDKWTTMAAMNRERCRFTLTECGGRLYAVGGSAEDTGDSAAGLHQQEDECTVEMYDPNSDAWTRMPGLPGLAFFHAVEKERGFVIFQSALTRSIYLLVSFTFYGEGIGAIIQIM